MSNKHIETIQDFGDEWVRHDQSILSEGELEQMFANYFMPEFLAGIGSNSEGFDFGCGSGRWARLIAGRVGTLHCIDASDQALSVAKRTLARAHNCRFHFGSIEEVDLKQDSQDFGYSLGVLHHIPETEQALKDCVEKLKPGGLFLVYLYYRFDNRPIWFQLLWRASDIFRKIIVRLPHRFRNIVTDLIALFVYFPLSRLARLSGIRSSIGRNWPLRYYANSSLATLRTDARDRFGTHLEQRFTRAEIEAMFKNVGLEIVRFSEREPYWTVLGRRKTV